jgi:ribosomal protein S18 acetylase RimI-like enzyme
MTSDISISRLTATEVEARLDELAALLHACVEDGASVNFVHPYSLEDAKRFWARKVLPRVGDDQLTVLVAEHDGRIAGSVQLDCDTPPNQAHRADIKKLLVHPAFQRRGIGWLLMKEIEAVAQRLGRSLLTLDTRSGDKGEPLYLSVGFIAAGTIPAYSRDARSDRLDAATFMYKLLNRDSLNCR